MQRNKVIFFTVFLICIQQNIMELFSECVKWEQGNLSSKCSIECRELSDERDFCFVSCAWLLDVLQFSLNLNLRLASQQFDTSHCNYCACSLDIFHKSSQITKFFLREEKKGKRKRSCGNSVTVTHYQQAFECSNCLLWSMEHLKHFCIKDFAVSAQVCAYSLLDAWDT